MHSGGNWRQPLDDFQGYITEIQLFSLQKGLTSIHPGKGKQIVNQARHKLIFGLNNTQGAFVFFRSALRGNARRLPDSTIVKGVRSS